MKSIIALVLFIACATQVYSACVNTNYLYKDYGYGYPSRCGLYNNHYYDTLDYYPRDVVTYGAHYPSRRCTCGSCPSCKSAYSPVYSSYGLF